MQRASCQNVVPEWGLPVITGLLVGLLAYGFYLTHFSLPIDGEFRDNFNQAIALGRWGHAWLRALILPEPFAPWFTPFLAVASLAFAAALAARLLRLERLSAHLFCALLVSFPQMAYQFEFINQSDTIGIGYFLAVASVALFLKGEHTKGLPRLGFFVCSMATLTQSVAIYQTLIVIPPVLLLGHAALARTDPRSLTQGWATVLRFLIITGLALMAYMAATHALQHHYARSDAGYLTAFVRLDTDPATFASAVIHHLGQALMGRQNYAMGTFGLASVAALAGIIAALARRPRALTTALALTGVWLLPLALCLTSVYALPPRVYIAMGLSFAIVLIYWLRRLPAPVGIVVTAVLVMTHAAGISQLFASDAAVRQADTLMANRIATTLYQRYPDFDATTTPVYFHGSMANDSPHKLPGSDVFGSSFFAWDGGNNIRLRAFFEYFGIGDWKNADQAQTYKALTQVDNMPTWPNPNAIQRHDGVMIIKLGEHTGWLPFSAPPDSERAQRQ